MRNPIRTGLLLLIFFIFCSQTKDSIAIIKIKCERINQNLKDFKKKTKEDNTESTDGGTISAYYGSKKLQLITAEYFGESGHNKTDYYFDNDTLICVVEKDFKYNRPYYYDKREAEENDDTEWFDSKKTKIETNRFYFNNNILLKWVDNKNRDNPIGSTQSADYKSKIFLETQRLIKLLK
jgi:hypothetical protein